MTPEEFQARRQDLELTQIQLAEELGITERAVRYYEKGERRIPAPIAKLIMILEKKENPQ